MITEELGQTVRTVVRKRCVLCNRGVELVDLLPGDAVDHRCGSRGTGSTWWIHRAAGR